MSDVDNELLIYNTAVIQCNCANAVEFWIGNTAARPTPIIYLVIYLIFINLLIYLIIYIFI